MNLEEALIAVSENEALSHGQVLYGLIKPNNEMEQVESTAAMVNVIPKKRIYRMEELEEMDLFLAELMKRPLVVQPSAYIGRGLAAIGCTLYTREERWILMINQAHSKIHSRLQMGIDMAKAKMAQGLPFVLEFSFNEFLKRIYLDRLTKAVLNKNFTFIDFEDAEIILRYPGDKAHRTSMKSGWNLDRKKKNEMRFEFEDLLPGEVTRRCVSNAVSEWRNPDIRIIYPDELHKFLPAWRFENKDPLDNIIPPDTGSLEEEEGCVGGLSIEDIRLQPSAPQVDEPPGKIVGRSRRKPQPQAEISRNKMQSPPTKYTVPVELHVPKDNGPQVLQRLDQSPSHASPGSPGMRNLPSPGRSPYENLDRRTHGNEHAYEGTHLGPQRSPRTPQGLDSPYEEMNLSRQYNQQHSPNRPTIPGALRLPSGPSSPHGDQQSPASPTTQGRPVHSPRTPVTSQPIRNDDRTRSNDRYNSSVNDNTRPSVKTYLTDDNDDDGGFSSQRSPHSPPSNGHYGNKDMGYNKSPQVDRYGNPIQSRDGYQSNDRYNDRPNGQQTQNSYGIRNQRVNDLQVTPHDTSSGNQVRAGQPVAAPRGFHRQQGSGRSDTSASDSGFGENEYGSDSNKYRGGDKYRNHAAYNNGGVATEVKTPYYNHAFEQDSSPEANVDNIMAKHKAMVANLSHQQHGVQNNNGHGPTNYNRTDRYNDPGYTRELKKWRENINDLEDSCDVNFTRTRLQSDPDKIEESFI